MNSTHQLRWKNTYQKAAWEMCVMDNGKASGNKIFPDRISAEIASRHSNLHQVFFQTQFVLSLNYVRLLNDRVGGVAKGFLGMDTESKLRLLSEDSQYDLACACGTNKQDRRHRGENGRWLYPVPLPQGGYSILLKTLFSNACVNDCKYCPLRSGSNVRRCTLKPDEVATLFMRYLKKNGVHGLFLSSGVMNTPDGTMQDLVDVAKILRKKHRFRGFIHLKIIPGASDEAIREAVSVSSAVSLNIETPGERHFKMLSERKNYEQDIIHPLKLMSSLTGKGERYSRVKCTTQFVVGAADETDHEIVRYMGGIYKRLNFNRVYFSAYQAGLGDSKLPGEQRFGLDPADCLTREHRLYQVDFLMRQYGFEESDIIFEGNRNLRLDKDPKEVWADNHPDIFPLNVNRADREALLKVPGLGPITVKRIIKKRLERRLRDLVGLNIKGKRLAKAEKYVIFD